MLGGCVVSRGERGGRVANGRSSIYRGKNGRWQGYVSMGRTDAGKPIRRHVRGRTRAEVSAKVAALESERARSGHRPSPNQQLTLGNWLDEWLVIIQRTRKPKTFDNYTSLVRAHCGPLRSRPLARIAVCDVDDLLYRVAERFPQSAVALHRILRSALNTAVKRGLLISNPCTHAVVPRVREVELEPYALEECRRLLLAATELPNGARWSVALALGLRQGETLGLMWDDIDFEKHQLRVRRQLQRPGWHHGCGDPEPDHKPSKCPQRTGGGWIFEDVKSRAGRRTLAVPPQLMQQLREHRRDQAVQQLAARPAWHEHDLVFPRPDGQPQHPSVDAKAWRTLTQRADVVPLRLHYARHTTATMLLVQGPDRGPISSPAASPSSCVT
jgi:integrase